MVMMLMPIGHESKYDPQMGEIMVAMWPKVAAMMMKILLIINKNVMGEEGAPHP